MLQNWSINERERESKRLRRFVTTFFLILSLLLQDFLFLVSPVYAALILGIFQPHQITLTITQKLNFLLDKHN